MVLLDEGLYFWVHRIIEESPLDLKGLLVEVIEERA